jgi:hypothetical protein
MSRSCRDAVVKDDLLVAGIAANGSREPVRHIGATDPAQRGVKGRPGLIVTFNRRIFVEGNHYVVECSSAMPEG